MGICWDLFSGCPFCTLIITYSPSGRITKKSIQLDSTQESINKVTAYIDEIYSTQNDMLDESYGNIIIALTEAVNNAISHGNKNIPEKKVIVSYIKNKDNISFTVEDEGNGFDFTDIPDPTDPKNIEMLNGRGIFLMKNLADEIEFHNEGKKVELIFNF